MLPSCLIDIVGPVNVCILCLSSIVGNDTSEMELPRTVTLLNPRGDKCCVTNQNSPHRVLTNKK